ncbi:MAG: prepilin-type N-terminal cleavage/methylation domain-containing protein [Ferrimonas sp.]
MTATSPFASRGFSLLEVLVSALIFTLGALGLLQLHWYAKRTVAAAQANQLALQLASDMLTRLQLNPSEWGAYPLVEGMFGLGQVPKPTLLCEAPAALIEATIDDAGSCTPAHRRQWDQYWWDQALAGRTMLRQSATQTHAIGMMTGTQGCLMLEQEIISVVIRWPRSGNRTALLTSCSEPATSESHHQVVLSALRSASS